MVNDIKGQLRFGFEGDVFGNTGSLASLAIIGPFLGQVQPAVDDRCRGAMHQRGIHAGLTVIDLAEAAAPLAGYADGLLPFLGYGAFVENKSGVRGTSQKTIGIQSHLIHHRSVIPGRMRREMLQ